MAYNPFSRRAKALRQLGASASPASAVSEARPPAPQRLVACAVQRAGVLHQGHRSHYELRRSLGWPDPLHGARGDVEGFVDNHGVFLPREQAKQVAIKAGQLPPEWATVGRPVLSSDLTW